MGTEAAMERRAGLAYRRPKLLRRLCYASVAIVLALAVHAPAPASAAVNPALNGYVADTVTLPGATAVAVAGNYAYVADYYAGTLAAIDISNPSSPVIAGTSPPSNNLLNASTVNIAGGYAYVVAKNRNGPSGSGSNDDGTGNSLTILDIASNPRVPAIVGSIRDANTLFGAYGVAVSGHYAFVAAQGCLSGQPCPQTVGAAFSVIDISNPTSPLMVAALHNNALPAPWKGSGALGHATSVAVAGNYAYVTAAYSNHLTVVNIANPLSPTIVASLLDATNLNFPVDVAVRGSYAYVVDQISPGRLTVLDVSNPSSPQVVASLSNSSLNGAYRIRLHGNFAYVSASSTADVAVVDISNPLSPRLAATLTSSAHLHKTTGLDVDASGAHLVASSPYLSTETQPLYPPYALQSGGPTLTGTVSAVTLDPSPIAASIAPASEPANPTAQTSANFSFSVNDAVATVQCRLDSGAWLACTSQSTQAYSGLGEGAHTFTVQATDAAGNTSIASYSWTVTVPANTSPPSISGSASAGGVLSASPGAWTGSPTFAYQWLRCDANGLSCWPISGAISSSYAPVAEDAGLTLEVQVSATSSAGSSTAESSPTAVVTAKPENTSLPAISGTATQGQTLSSTPGSWSGYPAPSFAYQWQRCDQSGSNCSAISGANAASYTLEASENGSTVELLVEASNSAGSAQASSSASAVVSGPPTNTAPPTINGEAAQGQILSASPGSWSGSPEPTYAYQWQRCDQGGLNCSAISEASAPTYTLQASDAGTTIVVLVSATNSAGQAQASSAASAIVTAPPAATAPPTLAGSAVEGGVLTASGGSWSGYPVPSLSYQWERCNGAGQSCAAIPGANAASYTAVSADVGATLLVAVAASNTAGSASAPSAVSSLVSSAAGPQTSLLDDFARPNNSGPPGPNWTHMIVSSSSPTNDLFITNQQVTGRAGSNADFWNPQAFGPNSEVWLTVAVKPNVDLDPVVLGLRTQNPATAEASGYQAYYIYRATQSDQYKIISRINGTTSQTLAIATGPTLNAGDRLLFRAIGTTLELWRFDAGAWTRVLSATDSTFQGAGYLSLSARNGKVRLANFGGGTLP